MGLWVGAAASRQTREDHPKMTRRKPNPDPMRSASARLSNAIRLHGEDSPQARAARFDVEMASAELTIRKLVAQAPPLPEENRRRLAAILLNSAA